MLDSFCVSAQSCESTLAERWDGVSGNFSHCLAHCVFQRIVFCSWVEQHLLQQQWAEVRLELGPETLHCVVVLWTVRNIPDWLYVQFCHLLDTATVDCGVVKEQKHFLVSAASSYLDQEIFKLPLVKAEVFYGEGQQLVALTHGSADCLARLPASSVTNAYVGPLVRPCFHLESSGCENRLIEKNQMALLFFDVIYLRLKSKSLVFEFLDAHRLVLRPLVDSDDFLCDACFAHDSSIGVVADPSVREVPVEQDAAPKYWHTCPLL